MPVDKEAWLQKGGAHGWATAAPAYSRDALHSLLPWLAIPEHPGTFAPADLRELVRQTFKDPPPVRGGGDVLDRAFTSLRTLGEQMHMAAASSSCTTRGVRVDVTTACLGVSARARNGGGGMLAARRKVETHARVNGLAFEKRGATLVSTLWLGALQRQDELDPAYDEEDGEPPKHLCTYRVRISNVG